MRICRTGFAQERYTYKVRYTLFGTRWLVRAVRIRLYDTLIVQLNGVRLSNEPERRTTGTYINLYEFVVLRTNVQNPNAAHDRVGYAYAVVRCGISTTVYGVFISMIGSSTSSQYKAVRRGAKIPVRV